MVLDREEIKILENYIDTYDRLGLEKIFEKHKRKIPCTLYRGSKVLKEELEVGNTFPHSHPYTSWSEDFDVAEGFAKCDYIPEKMLSDVSKKIMQDRNIEIYSEEIPAYLISKKEEIINYCYFDSEVYENIFEEKVLKKELSYEDFSEYTLNVLFITETEPIGININELLPQNEFKTEKEILLDTSNVKIVSIEKNDDCYIVKVA